MKREYEFEIAAPQARVNRDLDSFDARLRKSMVLITAFKAEARSLGTVFAGLAKAAGELDKIDSVFKKVSTSARRAGTALEKIKLNPEIAAMTKALEALDAELRQKVPDANAAAAALKKVGVGGPLGAPGPGEPGAGGNNHAMLRGAVRKAMGAGLIAAGAVAHRAGADARGKREFLQAGRERVSELRKNLDEYAALRDEKAGPTDRIVDEVTSLALGAGVSVDDSTEYLTALEGSSPAGRDKGNVGGVRKKDAAGNTILTPAQVALDRDIAMIGAQFAGAVGLDAKTAGDLSGVVGQYTKIRQKEDFAKELGAMHYGLDKGRGAISTLARSELGQAGASIYDDIEEGRISGLGELGAWIGVTSSISKTGASSGTSYKQVSRLLNTLEGKGGGEFLSKSGVRAARGDTAKLNALADYFGKNKVGNLTDFLGAQGFENSEDIRATVAMIGQRDVLNKRIAEGKQVSAQDVLDRIAVNQRSISMQTRKAAVAEDVAMIEQGKRQERVDIGRTTARASLINRGQLKADTFGESTSDYVHNWLTWGAETGEEVRIDTEMAQQLQARAKKVGIHDATTKLSGIMLGGMVGGKDEEAFRDEYGKQLDRVMDAEAAAEKALNQAAQQLQQAGRAVGQLRKPMGGANKAPGFVQGRR